MHFTETDFRQLEQRLDQALTVELIATKQPLQTAAADNVESIARQMEDEGFDVLPVEPTGESFWVHPRALPGLAATGPTLMQLAARDLVARATPILSALGLMVTAKRRFYFVLDGAQVSCLITYSDMDKRPARTAVFALVNAVEDVLLRTFKRSHTKDEEWESWLAKGDLKQIENYWSNARSRGVELSKVHYASFAQVTTLAARSPVLGPAMSAQFGEDWVPQMNLLRKCARDPVAHPGKPLIAEAEDVEDLAASCRFGRAILSGLTTIGSD